MKLARTLLGAALTVTACGSAHGALLPKVSGEPGRKPAIQIPAGQPGSQPQVRVLHAGSGPRTAPGQVIVTNVDMRVWQGSRQYLDTWSTQQPTTVVLDGQHVSTTWQRALQGRPAGSRVLLVSPATQGFGPHGMAPSQVSPTDTLVEVFDILGGYPPGLQVTGSALGLPATSPQVTVSPGSEPRITVPHRPAPARLTVQPLVAGTGPQLAPGSTAIIQYTAALWDNGQIFDSSYRRGGPTGFVLEARNVLPGWLPALTGARVGSRLLITVPRAMNQGIHLTRGGLAAPPDKAAVYVIDILDRH